MLFNSGILQSGSENVVSYLESGLYFEI